MNFLTETYRNEMAHRLQTLGYKLRTTAHGFEIEGVSEEIIQRFSKGRRAILAESARLEQELQHVISNNSRAAIAHHIRARKLHNLSSAEVRALQRSQLSQNELAELERLKANTMAPQPKLTTIAQEVSENHSAKIPPGGVRETLTVSTTPFKSGTEEGHTTGGAGKKEEPTTEAARLSLDFARDHLFERKSVVYRKELLALALKHGRGKVRLAQLETELASRTEFLIRGDAYATKEGLKAERRIIELVNSGVERCRPLCSGHRTRKQLTQEQNYALTLLLESHDQMMSLRGAAGTGKTEVLHEFVEVISKRHEVLLLAPTKSAVKALQATGLSEAQTVQWFLTNPSAHDNLRHPVVVLDEAGLLSNRQMLAVVEWVHQRKGRLVLAGDTRQHSGVEAGDSLRVLEKSSAIQKVPLRQIQRQTHEEYRAAIADLAEGRGARAVERLEKLGAVKVLEAEDNAASAPPKITSNQCRRENPRWSSVRPGAKWMRPTPGFDPGSRPSARCHAKNGQVTCHRSLKWTQAQKRDFKGYTPGLVLNFHTTSKAFKAGESA